MTVPQIPHVSVSNPALDISNAGTNFAAGLLQAKRQRMEDALAWALAQARLAEANRRERPFHIQRMTAQGPENVLVDAEGNDIKDLGAAPEYLRTMYGESNQGDPTIIGVPSRDRSRFQGQGQPNTQAPGTQQPGNQAHVVNAPPGAHIARPPVVGTTETGANVIVHPSTPKAVNTLPPGVGKPLTTAERNAAGAAESAKSAHNVLTQLENGQHGEQIMQEVARAIATPAIGALALSIPIVSGNVDQVLQQFRLAGVSPQAQEYLKRMFDFAGLVGPKRYGLRGLQSQKTLAQLWTDFGAGQFGLTRLATHAAQTNRQNVINQMFLTGGPRAEGEAEQLYGDSANQVTPMPQGPINPRFAPWRQ